MKRPQHIVYWLNEKPPLIQNLGLSFQQMLTICVPLVLLPIILGEGNVSSQEIISITSFAMFSMGVGTVLQVLWYGPVGSGFLAPPLLSAIYLNASILAVKEGGLPCLMTMTMFAGLFEILISRFLNPLRYLFTPSVIGLIVFTVGYILGIKGFEKIIDTASRDATLYSSHLLVSGITLFLIFAFSVWCKGILKLLCVFVGVLIGAAVAFFFGLFDKHLLAVYHSLPYLYVPSKPTFSFHFSDNLIMPFAICAVVGSLRSMGTIITSQQINDADWTHPDYHSIKKGVLADGIAATIAGFFGASGISASPSSVGVAKLTGATSRYIAFVLAALLMLCAFVPKVSGLFMILPKSIAGVALLVNGSFMMLAGLQLITSKPVDVRTIFIIGISLAAGTSRIFMHEYYEQLTGVWMVLTSSVLSITTLSALFITALSRIDIKQHHFYGKNNKQAKSMTFSDFLSEKLEQWSLPINISHRVTECATNVMKMLTAMGVPTESVDVDLSYDQINLTLNFIYQGDIPQLSLVNLSEQQDLIEEQAFQVGLTRMLAGVFPDSHDFSSDNGHSTLKFSFYC